MANDAALLDWIAKIKAQLYEGDFSIAVGNERGSLVSARHRFSLPLGRKVPIPFTPSHASGS